MLSGLQALPGPSNHKFAETRFCLFGTVFVLSAWVSYDKSIHRCPTDTTKHKHYAVHYYNVGHTLAYSRGRLITFKKKTIRVLQ